MPRKTYGQFCALAKALDRIGERWTLLIVRELLVRPSRYSDLKDALPGIATNLLAQRLRDLQEEGLVQRLRGGAYELTRRGRGLEPVVRHLIGWGSEWMEERAPGEVFKPQWLALALDALLVKRPGGCIELHVDDEVMHLRDGRVRLGRCSHPKAEVYGDAQTMLGVAAGRLPLRSVRIRGDRELVRATFA